MTELHCHILPGIDDGARSPQDSILLLKKEYEEDVRQIVLTSHYLPENQDLDDFIIHREKAYACMKEAMAMDARIPGNFTFKLGAEVFFSPRLCELDVRKLCIEETGIMLLEFPITYKPYNISEIFYFLQSKGITPLIAHIERYPYVMNDPDVLYDWIAAGCLAQVNAAAIIKGGKRAKQVLNFIKWNLVHTLGSDAHSIEHRPPNLAKSIQIVRKRLGDNIADGLILNSDLIFQGELPDTMSIHHPKKFRRIWI